jgi:hypothetical protein
MNTRRLRKRVISISTWSAGAKDPHFQLAVAAVVAVDAHETVDAARFPCIMGDVVYYNGEDGQYYPQFYEHRWSAVTDRIRRKLLLE